MKITLNVGRKKAISDHTYDLYLLNTIFILDLSGRPGETVKAM